MITQIYQMTFYATVILLVIVGGMNLFFFLSQLKARTGSGKGKSGIAVAFKLLGFRRLLIPNVRDTKKTNNLLNLAVALFIVLIMFMWAIYFWSSWPTIKILITQMF